MGTERFQALLDAAKESTQDQLELNKQSLTNNLDAADRIIMRKAADAAIQIASNSQADPT